MKKYDKKAIYTVVDNKGGFIDVTEWKNGDGVDVEIVSAPDCRFQITYDNFSVLKKLVKKLNK